MKALKLSGVMSRLQRNISRPTVPLKRTIARNSKNFFLGMESFDASIFSKLYNVISSLYCNAVYRA
jgi:hypothetical protein